MAQGNKGGEVGANTDRVVLLAKASSLSGHYSDPVAAARLEDLRRQITGVEDHGAIADKLSGNNEASELRSYAVQVLVEGAKAGHSIPLAPSRAMAAREGARCGGNLSSAVLGIVVASSAVTALAGGAVSPAVAFGSFLVLLAGVALVMASVRATA